MLLEALRSQRYERQRRERLAHRLAPDWQTPWTPEWHEHLEQRLIVGDAVDRLPADLQEAVVLHYFAELPVAAVARQLAITPGAVKTRLWRARRALRSELDTVYPPVVLASGGRPMTQTQPVYSSVQVALHVGGERYPVTPYAAPAFPAGPGLTVEDLRLAVDRLHAIRVAGDRPLTTRLGMWPAPDPFEHQAPAAVWSLLREAEVGEDVFHATQESRLIPTDGWRLGTDPNWRAVLDDLQEAGVRHAWFTFLGLEATHDELSGCPGSFAAITAALERCASVGMQTGANIVVSTRNTREIGELAELIRALGAERFVPTYVADWTPLGHAYESIRPGPSDLVGLPPTGLDVNWGYARFWENPEEFTERALTRAVLQPDEVAEAAEQQPEPEMLPLFVDAKLDLFVGTLVAPPLMRVANLRRDAPQEVYTKLAAVEWPPQQPSDAQLAAQYGDLEARGVHIGRLSVRRKWLAAWRAEHQLAWLAGF